MKKLFEKNKRLKKSALKKLKIKDKNLIPELKKLWYSFLFA